MKTRIGIGCTPQSQDLVELLLETYTVCRVAITIAPFWNVNQNADYGNYQDFRFSKTVL